MRIGFVELVLLLFIASITVGPNVVLFVDRWLRRAQRTSAAAARRKAQLEAQAAIEREALMTRFRVASNIFALLMLAALAYGLLLRPIDTPPKAYTAPDVRQDTGAAQTALSADSKDSWKLGGYLGVDCVRTQDGLVYAAAYNGAAMKKRQSDLVRTDGGHTAAILSVEGELTSFAFDADGDLWLTVVTPSGGALCRARHDSWGTSVEQVVTQIDGAPLGVLSAVETGPDGKVYFAVSTEAVAKNGLESALRTELIAHTGTGCVYVYDPSARTVEQVLGGVAGAAGLALSEDGRTLYVSDLGNRCIWSVDADARDWRWTRTARSISATAGPAAAGWKSTRTAPFCGASPCGPVRTSRRSCSSCLRTPPAPRLWTPPTEAGSRHSRAESWTVARRCARREAKCISARQALPACCLQEYKTRCFL